MHIEDFELFKGGRGNVLSTLTLNDVYWGADIFIATILN